MENKRQASIQAALKNNILLGKHFQVLIAGFKTVGVEDETETIIAVYDLHISAERRWIKNVNYFEHQLTD